MKTRDGRELVGKEAAEYAEEMYRRGLITAGEKRTLLATIWFEAGEEDKALQVLRQIPENIDAINRYKNIAEDPEMSVKYTLTEKAKRMFIPGSEWGRLDQFEQGVLHYMLGEDAGVSVAEAEMDLGQPHMKSMMKSLKIKGYVEQVN